MTVLTTAPAAPTLMSERGLTLEILQGEAAIVRQNSLHEPAREVDQAVRLARALHARNQVVPRPEVESAAIALLGVQRDLASL